MGLKDKIKLFPWDKLSHYQWGSWISPVFGVAAMIWTILQFGIPIHRGALVCAMVTLCLSAAMGYAGEYADKLSNDRAIERGEEPKRSVSEGDVIATFLGGFPTAGPMAVLYALGVLSTGQW